MSGQEKFYLGWQVGLSYEAASPEGNSREKILNLLDEMADNGMNILSLMMTGYARFDPMHDGFCWPVKNPKLECLRDVKCLNADVRTEYVSAVIEEAEKRGIEIQLFSNLAIYNPERIRISYPGAAEQKAKDGEIRPWLFCPDSDDVWQLEKDEIEDLLTIYNHKNVRSISFERLSFSKGSCWCRCSEAQFFKDTGYSIAGYGDGNPVFDEWKNSNINGKLRNLNEMIKTIKPGTEVWLHSSCVPGWGHDPKKLKEAGVDCVVPHIAHFPMNQQDFNTVLDRINPNDKVLHFCVRNKALQNYRVWEKNPQIIAEIGEWIEQYRRENKNLKGILFFNENTVSKENRNAVYRLVEKLK